ncbi:Oestrogen-responsive protein [Ophiocordyceps sinensis CO18]|uniref:Oestrogen-responsive protein n=1 Tax=Ophiocordyceps sinensis (strain Co18 / CGMCC 3.14243) TaxID=911162 RepID=T5ALL1_OPHSC|nr:Oestrogen-responsive protein [Ophiocordyceps sinensis CO18]
MRFLPTVGKARKPKFELHLKIYHLNNVPLVSGHSFIKWHLAHSMHAEHRGRTAKCPISNHKVDYSFSKLVPSVRISIDRNNNLAECPLEIEVLQEFPVAEKITLGHIRLNLSEYVEESEALAKDVARHTNSNVDSSSTSTGLCDGPDEKTPGDGIVRRYLMQDSKVNSTLKIGILMVQVDGERHFVAPPLRTAPVFGGIASFMGPDQAEDEIGRM